MSSITDALKNRYQKLVAMLAQLPDKLKACPKAVLFGIPAGAIALGCVIGLAASSAQAPVDPRDLRSPQYEVQAAPERFDVDTQPVF
jgi:hypothetical protein